MKYQLILLFAFLTSIQCRSVILDEETPNADSDKSKRMEISFIDELKNIMEQFIRKNVIESTTNLPWLTLPLTEGFSDQTIWQLPRTYFKRSENSDSILTKQKDNIETLRKLSIEEENKMIKTCAEQIDEMLLFIQNALGQFRKYLNEWCRNHHLMVKISPESSDTINISPTN